MYVVSWCFVVLHRQTAFNKIVFSCLYFVVCSHLHVLVERSHISNKRYGDENISFLCVSACANLHCLIQPNLAYKLIQHWAALSTVQPCMTVYVDSQTQANCTA